MSDATFVPRRARDLSDVLESTSGEYPRWKDDGSGLESAPVDRRLDVLSAATADYVIRKPEGASLFTVTRAADLSLLSGTLDGWKPILGAIHDETLTTKASVYVDQSAGLIPPGSGTLPALGAGRTDWLDVGGADPYTTGFQLDEATRNMHTVTAGAGINAISYYRYMRFRNLCFDANSSVWSSVVPAALFGSNPTNIVRQKYVGFEHWHFIHVCFMNGCIPNPDDDDAGRQWRWLSFDDWHFAAMEGDPNNPSRTTDIMISGLLRPPDGSPAGGYKLLQAGGKVITKTNVATGQTGGNMLIDDIVVEDFYYDTGADTATYETHAGGGGMQIGFYAADVRKVRVRRGTFVRCADIPTSIYNVQDGLMEDVTAIDSHAFACGTFVSPTQTGKPQRMVYRDVHQKFIERKEGLVGWNITGAINTSKGVLDGGTVIGKDCSVEFNNPDLTGTPRVALWLHSGAAPDKVDFDIAVNDQGWSQANAQVNKGLVQLGGGQLGVKKTFVRLRLHPRVRGTTSGTGQTTYPFVQINKGAYINYDIDIHAVDVSIAGVGLAGSRLKFLQHSFGNANEEDLAIVDATDGKWWIVVTVPGGTTDTTVALDGHRAPGEPGDTGNGIDVKTALINLSNIGASDVTSVDRSKNDSGVGFNYDIEFATTAGAAGVLEVTATDGGRGGSNGQVINASNVFTAVGAGFSAAIDDVGRLIVIEGVTYTIASIVSPDTVHLSSLYGGATSSAAAWFTVGSATGGDGVSTVRVHKGNEPSHEEGVYRASVNNLVGVTGPQIEQWDVNFDVVGPCYSKEHRGLPIDGKAQTFDGAYPNGLNGVVFATADHTGKGWEEFGLVDATLAPVTWEVPGQNKVTKPITIKKVDASSNPVFIVPAAVGTETIDGAPTYVLTVQWQSVTLLPVPTGYLVI